MKKIRYNFSLIELLSAVSIFAILMVVTMSIFSTSMNVLSQNVSNSKISASAKIALDYIEDMLINAERADLFVKDGKHPDFNNGKFFDRNDPPNDQDYEIEFSPNDDDYDYIAFRTIASFESGNKLDESRYGLFGVALNRTINDPQYRNLVVMFDVGNDGFTSTQEYQTQFTSLLSNVCKFKMAVYDNEFNSSDVTITKDNIKYVKIDLEILSDDDFEKWQNMTGSMADDFYSEKVYQFSRIVTLP